GNGFLPKYAILRKIALLANLHSSEKRSIICDGGVIMDYITTKEAAAKWNVSDRRVLQYCNADRIKGAIKMGNTWLIPKGAEKPVDGRTKQGKKLKHE
ncbi:helix-turn-helix domain-containing protein, partial [Holdemania filiformis]|uniref:helix-turn-helix domain-containing protein n=1 Tax=Holdemania filiformis TaxID=61171 RepID=UPI003F5D5119